MASGDSLITMGIVIVLFILVLFLEFRYFRRRGTKKKFQGSELKQDRAYNELLTTKSVRNKLHEDGFDTSKVEYIIKKAQTAIEQRDYDSCVEFCDKAKQELLKCNREGSILSFDESSGESGSNSQEEEIPIPSASDAIKKIANDNQGQYMQSQFELNCARDELKRSSTRNADREKAEKLIEESAQLFDSGEYEKSLSVSFKARKLIAGEETESARPIKKDSDLKCPDCGATVQEEDVFCGSCGKSLKKTKCNSCGEDLIGGDKFCRKCGKTN